MPKQDKKTVIRQVSFVLIMILTAIVILPGCKKEPDEQIQPEQYPNKPTQSQPTRQGGGHAVVPTAEGPAQPAKPFTNITTSSKRTLDDIIRAARTWGPAYKSWYGKHAPDFTLTDIAGKQHKLSNYRGKNVMIIFWATWCRPCLMEIPHLIELRNSIGENKLAMLAISYIGPRNSTETVKKFVAANPIINYTVISTDVRNMPRPYSLVTGIPSSFFIDPQGRIKLATTGLTSLGEIKAILQAPLEVSLP